ncbi:tellurite resistance TerB family protein [Limnothrix sp. FACHB-1083]|uniref:tellurite resistance TerB family protein n=1 Tax=unclassified Limnothrix TaxID=2632864 RepID=UPI0016818174|nr:MULTISPECIES: tellurite resistance TerB family protein [unclassified Limnothrix]MBD2161441.1 tellurite resistance TerB family protein [Limnothrix sp. FACHB-1083]MBD2192048.1 tellurite resistance TerB family protein [Limnothrix sp. FACHB-1088]
MGLLDSVFRKATPDGTITLSSPEAFAAILVIAMAADGYATDEEVCTLRDSLYRMQLFKRFDEEHMAKMIDKLLGIMQAQGPDALFQGAQVALPEDLRETAYAVAADMTLTDGTLDASEQEFLTELASALAISPQTAELLITAMTIKNRG